MPKKITTSKIAKAKAKVAPKRAAVPAPRSVAAARPPPRAVGASRTSGDMLAAVHARAKASIVRDVSAYGRMILDPYDRSRMVRYPDETLVETCLTQLIYSTSHTVATPDLCVGLDGKLIKATTINDGTTSGNVGSICLPKALTGISVASAFASDYGDPQSTMQTMNARERTLAAGVRVRLTGLPSSTFLPSGRLYFLQLSDPAQLTQLGTELEPYAIQSVQAGNGFSMTLNELGKLESGASIPLLPVGPGSFAFSQNQQYAASAIAGKYIHTAPVTVGGSAVLLPTSGLSPYPFLIVACFGVAAGTVLQFDFAHVLEYVPTPTAAGLLDPKVEMPSVEKREQISRMVGAISERVGGATSAAEAGPIVAPQFKSVSKSLDTADKVLNGISAGIGLVDKGLAIANMAAPVAAGLFSLLA